jgi:hypothetical protein
MRTNNAANRQMALPFKRTTEKKKKNEKKKKKKSARLRGGLQQVRGVDLETKGTTQSA